MARKIAIWAFGLLGCGGSGFLIGDALMRDAAALGFIAGACLFACARLWSSENRVN